LLVQKRLITGSIAGNFILLLLALLFQILKTRVMKHFLLCTLLFLAICNLLYSQKIKDISYIPPAAKVDSSLLNAKGNFNCQVIQLITPHKQTAVMIIFVETGNAGNKGRTKIRTNYLLKRERLYLRNIFFSNVEVLENFEAVIDIKTLLQKLDEKYDKPQLWSILRADTFFNTAHQRSENSFALYR
jgi:hypothetical protein